jgi:hypothetical protein
VERPAVYFPIVSIRTGSVVLFSPVDRPPDMIKMCTQSLPIEVDLKVLDRVLGCLLILAGIGHTFGSLQFYKNDQMTLLWSLSASLFVFLLATINLVRAARPADATLAWICLVANLCQIASTLRFGVLIGTFLDFRVVIFLAVALGLCAMSVRTLIRSEAK